MGGATSQAVACSEPRCSLVNFSEGVDPVYRRGKTGAQVTTIAARSLGALRGSRDGMRGQFQEAPRESLASGPQESNRGV